MRKYPISSGGPRRGATILTKTEAYDQQQLAWAKRILAAPEGSHSVAELEVARLTVRRLEGQK